LIDLGVFYPHGHEAHREPGHPERPERIESILTGLQESGIWDQAYRVSPYKLELNFLGKIHSPDYLSLLERTCKRGGHLDNDTYVTPASWNLALNAAGGAAALIHSVWVGENKTGLALTRPPGHHAMRGQGMGFCLLNNIAVAAEYLIKVDGARRLAIVDLDLHHGNGTQDIFWERSDVLFISTHQRPLYPGTGSLEERGRGEGLGFTANFPLPPGSGDRAFHTLLDQAVLPLLQRFNPEMLLISYGFDTHWNDPLGHLLLSADGYAGLVASLRQFAQDSCGGKIAAVLEGGYDLSAAAACTTAIVNALLGSEWTDPLGPSPYPETDRWRAVLAEAQQIWDL